MRVVEREREVGLERVLEHAPLLVVHDVEDQAMRVFLGQGRHVDAHHLAVNAQHRLLSRRQVEVRRLLRRREPEEIGDGQHHSSRTIAMCDLAISHTRSSA